MIFQLTTPLLDGCVLAILDQGDAYGYSLTQRIKGEIDISESTLYPVLRRLQKEGCLAVYELLKDCRQSWTEYTHRVENILSGGAKE